MLFFLGISKAQALTLEIYNIQKEKEGFLFTMRIKDFPLQSVILALKEQKKEVKLVVQTDLLERRFLLPDLKLTSAVYFKTAVFLPEENLYLVQTDRGDYKFKTAEDVAFFLASDESYFFPYPGFLHKRHYMELHLKLTYHSHLNSNFKFTKKTKLYTHETSFIFDLFKD